jgi:hypothetical protein
MARTPSMVKRPKVEVTSWLSIKLAVFFAR